ncbi:hypothetical protein [Dyadobacter pollutisoli]|uniref:T9SS type A sorting domain-containing protein n=1 Tax=Dyadobacter pollutisoli TaxID=2910158 RepID=A0A9E8NEY3_9BACT|nr:hypothetical protein [Dyadobacter pollutisoli]WAC13062.1 hypothetical protein ON006_03670 [Dyadobacter pollutisoli]
MKKCVLPFVHKLGPLSLLLFVIFAGQLRGLAADVTYSTETLAAANVLQGTSNHPFYILKVIATSTAVVLNRVDVTTSGTYASGDVNNYRLYVNTVNNFSTATHTGNNVSAVAGNGETIQFTGFGTVTIPAGETRYLFITATIKATGIDGHTIKVNGAANPATVFYTAPAPIVTNNQTDAAGAQTIKAPAVTYSTEALAAANVLQGTSNHPFYVLKLVSTSTAIQLNRVDVTTSGTYTSGDVNNYRLYINTVSDFSTATHTGNNISAVAGNGETIQFTGFGTVTIPAGETRYLFITATIKAASTDGHTIKVNGAANPVSVFYTGTTPAVTNNQTDASGAQTIKAPSVTFGTETLASADVPLGTSNHPFYILKLEAIFTTVQPNRVDVTTSGTYTSGDVNNYRLYINTVNDFSTATHIGNNVTAVTGNGETIQFSGFGNVTILPGETRYFFVTATIKANATDGNTIKVDGSANPVNLFYAGTTPTVTNNQTDAAGTQTIGTGLPVTLVSFTGKKTGENKVTLDWVTSDEKAFEGFAVQRSQDAKAFENIGTVYSKSADHTVLRTYQFIDDILGYDNSYYRLKMIDEDGSFEYSKIIHIGSSVSRSIVGQLYPNPSVSTETYIDIVISDAGSCTTKSYDLSGRILNTEYHQLFKGLNKIKINFEKLDKGTFLILFEGKNQIEARTLIRQ